MKNTLKTSLILAGLLLAASMSFGQTLLTTTTLSAAVTTTSATVIPLTSATGVVATSTILFVDSEAMFVNSVNGTNIGVTRGYQTPGSARTHASSAVVWILPAGTYGTFAARTITPTGSCTRTNETYLPVIAIGLVGTFPTISDCVGGQWVSDSTRSTQNTPFRIEFPSLGSVAWTSVGTSTAIASATSMYCSEIDVPFSKYVTGLGVLNGATAGGTDKHYVMLYDATGNIVTNSAVAGVAAATANGWQTFAFTNPYYVIGPAKYYGCLQSNGTTDTVRMLTTGTLDNTTTKAVTGQTFGTVAASFTVPTTFTTVVGPVWEFY